MKNMLKLNVSSIMDDAISRIVEVFEEPLDEYDVHAIAALFKIKLNLASGNLTEKEAVTGVHNLDRRTNLLECVFTSEWDDGSMIVIKGMLDTVTRRVNSELSDSIPPKDVILVNEYVDIVRNGESVRYKVCMECHEFILDCKSTNDNELHCRGCETYIGEEK